MDVYKETLRKIADFTAGIDDKLAQQQSTYLDRQIAWRQDLIDRYQSEIEEMRRKQALLADAVAEEASVERTLSDTQEFKPVTVTPADLRKRRGA